MGSIPTSGIVCGRYTLTDPDPRMLRLRFELPSSAELDEEPRFNIAPTDPVLAIRALEGAREAGRLRWGLVPPGATPKTIGRPLINARAESVDSQPAFKEPFRERRCLIPADGFYEWMVDEDGKRPVWITLPDGELFSFAGLWSLSQPKNAEEVTSCALVTTEPTEQMRPIHDRMPVILPRETEAEWLAPDADPEALKRLLGPGSDGLEIREVGDFVNNVREDGPHLVEKRQPEPRLF
ncbi:MAG: SOS response-associated peptidase [Solirubrobacterales bacterium]